MKKLAMLLVVLALCVPALGATAINLGTAGDFGALAGSGVTNTGYTVINGDVGSYPTPAITGFPPGEVNGTLYRAANSATRIAKNDLVVAYNAVVAAADGNTSLPVDLSGKTLDPNVYAIGAANCSAGTLTLDGGGDANAQWIFHTTSLTTANNFNVVLTDGASASNVFWQVGTTATIGDGNFAGNILAMTTITFAGGASLNGRALARNGAVTFSGPVDINVPGFVRDAAVSNAILVYKVTMAINPEITYADLNGLEAEVWKNNLSAYVVFGVDTDSYVVQLPSDVNDANGPTAVLFFKDGRDKIQMTLRDNETARFVDISTFSNSASIEPFVVTNKHNTTATSVVIDFGDSNTATGFSVWTSLYGKNTSTNIGQGNDNKLSVAKSLKGQVRLNSDGRFMEGMGDAKATLDSRLTKKANAGAWTVAETVAYIQETVLRKYTEVTVLP